MKKKIVGKAILVLLASSLLLFLNYILFMMMLGSALDLQTVYVASHDIPPRTLLTEEDITEAEVSGAWLPENICRDKTEIIGSYTEITGRIPAGSPFYSSMVFDRSRLPDGPLTMLAAGQTSYTMETDITKLGSIIEGMHVDIHFSADHNDVIPAAGCLITQARVISIKDHQGKSISDPEGSGIPYLIEVAVSRDDLDLLAYAESEGRLRVFPAADPYDDSGEAVRASSETVRSLLEKMAPEE